MAKKHLFRWLQIKLCPKGLHSFAFSTLNFNFSSCFCAFLWLKNPFNQRLIKDLRSTKAYVRKNKLFLQNKAKFRKVKLNVNNVLTKDYDQMDTWSIRTTKPIQSQFKANQSQLKPIQSQSKPKQTQFKPKQTQFLPAISMAGQCSTMLNCAICSANTSTGPGKFQESTDTYYDRENTLVKCCEMVMLMPNVVYMAFRPKGNSNSRSKCAFEVETIQFGGKQL